MLFFNLAHCIMVWTRGSLLLGGRLSPHRVSRYSKIMRYKAGVVLSSSGCASAAVQPGTRLDLQRNTNLHGTQCRGLGPVSVQRPSFPCMEIQLLKIRRLRDRLIFIQHGDPYTGKTASWYWDGPLELRIGSGWPATEWGPGVPVFTFLMFPLKT